MFLAGLGVLLVCILLALLPRLLPGGLASKVAFNSEGYLLALALAAWVQFVRPRLHGRRSEWPVTAAVAAGSLVVGVALFNSDLTSRVKTLNETFIALSLILLYVQARRRPAPSVALVSSLVVLAIVVFGNRTEIVTQLAESLGMLLLVPVAFDVVDRGILDPRAPTSSARRYTWYALLVVMPSTFSLLWHGFDLTGLGYEITRYDIRMHEAFVGVLLVELYFAVGLGRTGTSDGVERKDPVGSPR